jgi:predicted RNA-binding protein with RPS1 domain
MVDDATNDIKTGTAGSSTGDIVPVVLKEIDEKGRYNLSIKAADPEWARTKGVPEGQGGGRGDHGGRRDERHQDRHRRI